jgi:fumarate hydratase subunit alpha
MRKVKPETITNAIAKLAVEANYFLGDDMREALEKGLKEEESNTGQEIISQILENADIAANEKMPICQDTGFAVVFLEIGNQVFVEGDINQAIQEGIRHGYEKGYLRKSIVDDPIKRENTGDNTPAVIHTKIVPGDKINITVAPKGGGSENMSQIKMLKPSDGVEGIRKFVLKTVEDAGANTCPPIIVGVGIGGTFEKAAYLSKKSLMRPVDDSHPESHIAELENDFLKEVNKLGIGPQGLGGIKTALAVKIEKFPCHIASLPVAVNLNCHAARHKEIVI